MSLDALLPSAYRSTRAPYDDASSATAVPGSTGEPRPPSAIGLALASIAGARADVLRRTPSARTFYAALGLAVLLTAVTSGLSMLLALGYALHEPLADLWPIAVLWGICILNLDRLMILTTVSRSRLGTLLVRVLISVALAFLIAEPLDLRVFARETHAVIVANQNAAVASERKSVLADLAPQLQQLQSRLDGNTAALTAQQNRTDRLALAADCERDGLGVTMPACRGVSNLIGEGPRYRTLVGDRDREMARLRDLHRRLDPQIAADSRARDDLLGQQNARVASSVAAIDGNDGLLARISALSQLQASNGTVRVSVWLLRLVLVLLDLAPVVVKGLQVFDGPTVYDTILSAERDREAVEAHRLLLAAELERDRITRRKDLDDDIDEFEVDQERERVLSGFVASDRQTTRHGRPLRTPSLDEVTARMRPHERQPAPFSPALRRAALVGTALLAVLALLVWLIGSKAGGTSSARITTWSTLAGACLIGASSRGYRSGPPVMHVAAFAVALTGLALPVVVLVLTLTQI